MPKLRWISVSENDFVKASFHVNLTFVYHSLNTSFSNYSIGNW